MRDLEEQKGRSEVKQRRSNNPQHVHESFVSFDRRRVQ